MYLFVSQVKSCKDELVNKTENIWVKFDIKFCKYKAIEAVDTVLSDLLLHSFVFIASFCEAKQSNFNGIALFEFSIIVHIIINLTDVTQIRKFYQ